MQGHGSFPTERERRCYMNDLYYALRMLIPNPGKADRASVLKDGIRYINELRIFISELKNIIERKKCGGRHNNNNEVDNRNPSYVSREIAHQLSKMKLHNDEGGENIEKKPESHVTSNNSLRKSKVTEVYVRIVDDEVTIKIVHKKKINCLLFVSKMLDQLPLDLYHVDGGQMGEDYIFLLKTKIYEGSTIHANAIANRVIEAVDEQCMAPLPVTN